VESGVTTILYKDTQQAATSTTGTASTGFTDEERAALRERAHEQKAAGRRGPRGPGGRGQRRARADRRDAGSG
jgi:hypothetical protein